MANFTDIPFLNPIKFVPATDTPGVHFDDDWAKNQIKEWEMQVCWRQKWQFEDETPLHIKSTVTPSDLQVYDRNGNVVNEIEWTLVAASGTTAGNIYELTLQLDTGTGGDLPAGVYWLYQEVTNGGSYLCKYLSEPIDVRVSHKNTSLFTYTNSENTQGVYFGKTEVVFNMRIEAKLSEFSPGSDTTDYIDQSRNAYILSGTPFREWKLLIGNAPGVTDYTADLLNRIFCLDTVRIDGKLFTKVNGAKWEAQRVKGYPLAGWSLDVTESVNLTGLQHSDTDPLVPGVTTAYDINDDLYGSTTGSNIHIIDKETT